MTRRNEVTDEQMEKEIAELERSPATKLGRAAVNANIRERKPSNKRRQRLYTLRYFNKIGLELEKQAVEENSQDDDDIF
ncbi:MAG: hypothetical protein J6S49_02255 [Erysipelotrichaceae bacterium]|nr:hypothetical protein [Erysipelotrichaceae bacterium]